MTGCCTLPPREAPAIPLWINGRPVLAMVPVFHEIREAATQRLIRRVPMVDATLAASAIENANQAPGLLPTAMTDFLQALAEALQELEAAVLPGATGAPVVSLDRARRARAAAPKAAPAKKAAAAAKTETPTAASPDTAVAKAKSSSKKPARKAPVAGPSAAPSKNVAKPTRRRQAAAPAAD